MKKTLSLILFAISISLHAQLNLPSGTIFENTNNVITYGVLTNAFGIGNDASWSGTYQVLFATYAQGQEADSAVQPATLAAALASITTTTLVTNDMVCSPGGWYSNNLNSYIDISARYSVGLGAVVGAATMQAWVKTNLTASATKVADGHSYFTLLGLGVPPTQDSLKFKVPPHFIFCITNSAISGLGITVPTTCTNDVYMLP